MITDQGPRVFTVFDQGRKNSRLSESEIEEWRSKPCNCLLDLVDHVLHVRHRDENQTLSLPLNSSQAHHHGRQALLTPQIEMFRHMAERPGRLVSPKVMTLVFGHLLEPNTFSKYIGRIRSFVGDHISDCPLILTVRNVDRAVSDTGTAYQSDPESLWRVIAYADDLIAAVAENRP